MTTDTIMEKHEMEYFKQNSAIWPSAAVLAVLAIAIAGVMGTVANPASAAEDDYIFCEAGDRKSKVTYEPLAK